MLEETPPPLPGTLHPLSPWTSLSSRCTLHVVVVPASQSTTHLTRLESPLAWKESDFLPLKNMLSMLPLFSVVGKMIMISAISLGTVFPISCYGLHVLSHLISHSFCDAKHVLCKGRQICSASSWGSLVSKVWFENLGSSHSPVWWPNILGTWNLAIDIRKGEWDF